MDSYESARQLFFIVTQNEGKYVQFTQYVLHAMLSYGHELRDDDLIDWCMSVTDLIEMIKPNVDPIDLTKYIDIILNLVARKTIDSSTFLDLYASQVVALAEMFAKVKTKVHILSYYYSLACNSASIL